MRAQNSTLIGLPDLKVGLAGSVELPVVINRSERRGRGRMILHIGRLAREPLESAHVLLGGENGFIPDVPSTTINKLSLDAVVFADGEFAGPDTAHLFDVISMRVDAERVRASGAR